jgi:hypothetical protein
MTDFIRNSSYSFSYFQLGNRDSVTQKLYEINIKNARVTLMFMSLFLILYFGTNVVAAIPMFIVPEEVNWSNVLSLVDVILNVVISVTGVSIGIFGYIITTKHNIINPLGKVSGQAEEKSERLKKAFTGFGVCYVAYYIYHSFVVYEIVFDKWKKYYDLGRMQTLDVIGLRLVMVGFVVASFVQKARMLHNNLTEYALTNPTREKLNYKPPNIIYERLEEYSTGDAQDQGINPAPLLNINHED